MTYEQPHVRHLNEVFVALYTAEQTYTFGSTEDLNRLLGTKSSQTPTIEISAKDSNRDGKDEEITLSINVAGIEPKDVKQVLVLQSVSFHLQN